MYNNPRILRACKQIYQQTSDYLLNRARKQHLIIYDNNYNL